MRSAWDRRALPIYALIELNFVVGMIFVWATGITIGRDYWVTFLSWPVLAVLAC